jgi:predicted nucleotidyltransferase
MKIEEIIHHKDQIYQIAAKHNVTKVYVFGSVVRGESEKKQ